MTTGFAGDGVVHQFFGGAYWAKDFGTGAVTDLNL
jgi:hypothetical protein